MNESGRRLWGIDVIAGIYGLATLLLVWLCFNGSDDGRIFGMVLAPICAILSVGIALRVNVVRIALLILLGMAVVGDGLLILFFVGALAGPNKVPLEELFRMSFRLAATLTMFLYLKQSDVREAFGHRKMESIGLEEDSL